MVSALCQAPRLPCPEALQVRLGYSLLLHCAPPAPHGLSQMESEVIGYGQQTSSKSKSCGTAWQVIEWDTDAVALSSVCREARPITKSGHALHHSYVQEHRQTDGLISHIPLPNLLMLEVKDDLGLQPEKPLKYIHQRLQHKSCPISTEVPQRGPRGNAVGLKGPSCCLPEEELDLILVHANLRLHQKYLLLFGFQLSKYTIWLHKIVICNVFLHSHPCLITMYPLS